MSPDRIVGPWRSFLADIDAVLGESVSLFCLGGFAVTFHYGLDRPTGDIDVCEVTPREAIRRILELGGENSELHRRYGVRLQMATVPQLPESYEQRVIEVFVDVFQHLRLWVLDPHDLALSKLERNQDQDREDVKHLARAVPLDLELLKTRYEREVRPFLGRPDREDLTLKLWIDAIEEERAGASSQTNEP
jgi:hypothetical protein